MSFHKQKTIKNTIKLEGVGLHSGKFANLIIKPAPPNNGIIFIRKDLKKDNVIYPHVNNVSNAMLCTTVSNEFNAKVSTIEHLMGAFYGTGIDNATVEIDNDEIPILDGSAKIFVQEIIKSGIKISNIPIKVIRINKSINYSEGTKSISIHPSKINLEIDFEIKYNNELIGNQRNTLKVYEDDLEDTFNSRTFCLYEDIEKLKSMGFAKGGSLDNALVVKGSKLLNKDGLRNKNEFVNHKILDCMGDLYLSGYKIIGSLVCSQGGHSLTNRLLRKVFSDKINYSLIELKGKSLPHSLLHFHKLKSIA